MTRDRIAARAARKALGAKLRRKDHDAWARVQSVLATEHGRRLSHTDLADAARTTYETVRAVRRELGEVAAPTRPPTPIGAHLLRSLEPRHVATLKRLDAAHARGSDMTVRAILAGAEMQQLLTAARGQI